MFYPACPLFCLGSSRLNVYAVHVERFTCFHSSKLFLYQNFDITSRLRFEMLDDAVASDSNTNRSTDASEHNLLLVTRNLKFVDRHYLVLG